MGYRFTLETANIVANLTFGKVMSCYRSLRQSEEMYWGFRHFLGGFEERFYSNENSDSFHDIHHIRHLFSDINFRFRDDDYLGHDFDHRGDNISHRDRMALDALRDLSRIFSRCPVKSLLLPQVEMKNNEYCEDYMTSRETLHRALKRHPSDSCLILQPEERPNPDGLALFDTFPHFDTALRQMDRWPAVMFWTGEEDDQFAFVPVTSEAELLYYYEVIHYEKYNPLNEIKRLAAKKEPKPSHYYIHLSDLHFGAKNIEVAERRLRSLVRKQLESFEADDTVGFIVTGDGMDSPNKRNKIEFTRDCANAPLEYGRNFKLCLPS
ncbi:hypothetical protein FACS18949_13770 [Clostridia bacterium]|nr:hypothetical protein FACS189425_02630 [Clostridia bacterium]GHV35561.1 hypothetical protein FACS18949_13770 [Clostridia bacterium]